MRSARSSRYALRSTPTTRAAPWTRATAIAAQPIGPQPNTTTRAPVEVAVRAGVHRVAERLHGGGDVGSDRVADRPHVRHRYGEVGRERTVDVDADDARVLADVKVAATALVAVAAHDVRTRPPRGSRAADRARRHPRRRPRRRPRDRPRAADARAPRPRDSSRRDARRCRTPMPRATRRRTWPAAGEGIGTSPITNPGAGVGLRIASTAP